MTPAQQPQQEYIITEKQIKQIRDEYPFTARDIRTRPHTPAPVQPTALDEANVPGILKTAIKELQAEAARTATLAAIEMLSDLNKYSCEEYEEASLSDNEKEMRIHLEYGNRLWGIIRSLRTAQEQQR